MVRSLSFFSMLVLFLVFGGCSKVTSIEGTATLNGQPIEKGAISLRPVDGVGPSSGGMIVDGKYKVENIVPGQKIATLRAIDQGRLITSRDEAMKMIEQAKKEGKRPEDAVAIDLIPADAKGNSQTVEIAPGAQTLDFAVSTE